MQLNVGYVQPRELIFLFARDNTSKIQIINTNEHGKFGFYIYLSVTLSLYTKFKLINNFVTCVECKLIFSMV